MTWRDDPRPGADVLRAWAEARGLSDPRRLRSFLADEIGKPLGTIDGWIAGRREPPMEIRIILDLMDRVDELERRTGVAQSSPADA